MTEKNGCSLVKRPKQISVVRRHWWQFQPPWADGMTLNCLDTTIPANNSARSAFERVSQPLHLKAATK
jgi:hypothetical protein